MKQEIATCQDAIRQTHGCAASFSKTQFIREKFNGITVWEGDIHSFRINHPSGARICYAWAEPTDQGTKTTAVLGVDPVTSAKKAVQAALVAKIRGITRNSLTNP